MNAIEITRNSANLIKEKIVDLFKNSSKNLKGFAPKEVSELLANIKYDKPYINNNILNGELLKSTEFNKFLDLLYIDTMIQYNDLYQIRDYLQRIDAYFHNTVIQQINRIGEQIVRLSSIEKLSKSKLKFTDIIFESFNKNNNTYQSLNKLAINPAAGIIRLNGIRRDYANNEQIDIDIKLVSSNCEIIDSSDKINVFNNNPSEPYYITAITTSKPLNQSRGILDFGDIDGIIFDIAIECADIVPINRVGFSVFSDDQIEVIQIQYSSMSGQDIYYSGFKIIDLPNISYDNNTIEINFDRIHVKELHIFVKQKSYKGTTEPVKIAKFKHLDDYLEYYKQLYYDFEKHGFKEPFILDDQINEYINKFKENIDIPTYDFNTPLRSYTFGIYNLVVANIVYGNVGYYQSDVYTVNGNLDSISIDYSGKPIVVNKNNHVIATTIMSVSVGNQNIYLTTPDNGIVYDCTTLEHNIIYTNNTTSYSTEYPLKFSTHFIIDETIKDITVYIDNGQSFVLNETNCIITNYAYHNIVQINSATCILYNLTNGVGISFKYKAAIKNRYKQFYKPNECKIIERLGKPNIIHNNLTEITDSYLYIKYNDKYIAYEENEYNIIQNGNSIIYELATKKFTETIDGIIEYDTGGGQYKYYVEDRITTYPHVRHYAAVFDEVPETIGNETIDGKEYVKYKTKYPYIKGSLVVCYNDYTLNITEYLTDGQATGGSILPNSDKCIFYILATEQTPTSITYIPISYTESGSDITSNIAEHNITERFTYIPKEGIELSRVAYIDTDIVNSALFTNNYGVFSYRPLFSIIYEPFVIHVNGIKALNVTRYRNSDPDPVKLMESSTSNDVYMYYYKNKKLIFNKEITGNITIQYYSISDSLRFNIQMIRSDYIRDDLTPELYNFTAMANVIK